MDILLGKVEVEDDNAWGAAADASEGVEAEDGRVAETALGGTSSPSTRLEVIVRRILWYLKSRN